FLDGRQSVFRAGPVVTENHGGPPPDIRAARLVHQDFGELWGGAWADDLQRPDCFGVLLRPELFDPRTGRDTLIFGLVLRCFRRETEEPTPDQTVHRSLRALPRDGTGRESLVPHRTVSVLLPGRSFQVARLRGLGYDTDG